MKLVTQGITLEELKEMSQKMFGCIVKAVVDLEKQIMVVDAGLHSDQEEELLESGSKQGDLWGINLYPDRYPKPEWVEFDSMINLRPSWKNFSRGVDDLQVQRDIHILVNKLVIFP
jgi:hypothetical protein